MDNDARMARAEAAYLDPPEDKEPLVAECAVCGCYVATRQCPERDDGTHVCDECAPYYFCGDEFVLELYQNIPQPPYDARVVLDCLIDRIRKRAMELWGMEEDES